MSEAGRADDVFDLRRFIAAQEGIYASALAELRGGRKATHWMWFVFPQLRGLGNSTMAIKYSIRSRDEARHYLEHALLGERLRQCADAVLAIEGRSATDIFGHPDDMKLKSSMTLFAAEAGPGSVFARVLEKYFKGEPDARTLGILQMMNT